MAFCEYIRIVDNAKKAIVFIHGIVGHAGFFKEFVELVPDDCSIYNVLLDGHGKGVKEFSRASMKKWESQVKSIVDKLSSTHDEIYMVGHSMGTLLSIEQASKNPCVKKMFLMSIPAKVFVTPRLIKIIIKVYFNKVNPNNEIAMASKEYYGCTERKSPFSYIPWSFRIFELFGKIRRTKKLLPKIKTPAYVYQSVKDEVVSKRSIKYLKKHSNFNVHSLNNSWHCYHTKEEKKFLLDEFINFIK
ncbi:MAG: alpha/beta fold hydrolase [Clostridia bacterium]|nr:alpha/beta fold hydrolase [Clostridia bacterium]